MGLKIGHILNSYLIMKTQLMITASFASYAALAEQEVVGGRYWKRIVDRIEERLPEYFNKDVTGEPRPLIRYGCYCFPGKSEDIPGNAGMNNSKPRNGYRGPPVDEIDRLCMQLWQAEQCMEKDWQNNGYDKCNMSERKNSFQYWWDTNPDGSSNCDQTNH